MFADDNLDFYDSYSETADWVDSCIARVEEERIAQQLNEMEELFDENSEFTDELQVEDNEAVAESEGVIISDAPSVDMTDKNNLLAFSEFEREKFVSQTADGKTILIYAFDGNITRLFYDEKLKLEREENWLIKNADNPEIKKSIEYIYSKTGVLDTKKCTEGNQLEISRYLDNGLINKKEVFIILKNEDGSEKDKKITSSLSRTYNQNKEVKTETATSYTYTDDTYEKIKYTCEQKYVYAYNDGDIPPDFMYYEDGMLKMHNKYAPESGTYTSQIYFDENYSVKTYYENNVRTREVFFMDGVVRREKVYEKKSEPETESKAE